MFYKWHNCFVCVQVSTTLPVRGQGLLLSTVINCAFFVLGRAKAACVGFVCSKALCSARPSLTLERGELSPWSRQKQLAVICLLLLSAPKSSARWHHLFPPPTLQVLWHIWQTLIVLNVHNMNIWTLSTEQLGDLFSVLWSIVLSTKLYLWNVLGFTVQSCVCTLWWHICEAYAW